MNYNDVSYQAIPKDEECILNAVQIGKILQENPSTIRTWANLYEDYLYIKKINGRFVYTEASVNQFKFIKDLCRNKNMGHSQIREIISKQGFDYAKFDSGLVNLDDPLGFQALASAIALENKNQLVEFMNNFIKFQTENNKIVLEEMKREMCETIDEVVSSKLEEFKDEFIKEQQEEKEATLKTVAMVEDLHNKLNERKEENNKKSFWTKLFNK